jgi:hypothetical protein
MGDCLLPVCSHMNDISAGLRLFVGGLLYRRVDAAISQWSQAEATMPLKSRWVLYNFFWNPAPRFEQLLLLLYYFYFKVQPSKRPKPSLPWLLWKSNLATRALFIGRFLWGLSLHKGFSCPSVPREESSYLLKLRLLFSHRCHHILAGDRRFFQHSHRSSAIRVLRLSFWPWAVYIWRRSFLMRPSVDYK